jgi:hypothetical protein
MGARPARNRHGAVRGTSHTGRLCDTRRWLAGRRRFGLPILCLQYFRSFANLEIPPEYAVPNNPLSYYQGLTCPTKPRCDAINTGQPSPAILP